VRKIGEEKVKNIHKNIHRLGKKVSTERNRGGVKVKHTQREEEKVSKTHKDGERHSEKERRRNG
jgi:hypothetical protein